MDRLTDMLTQQLDFQGSLGYDFANATEEERVAYVKEMYVAAVQELGEALNETTWKSWTTAPAHVSTEAFISELVDAWHFIMNMLLIALPAASPDEVALTFKVMYDGKMAINRRRQQEGYDGKNKCPTCRRALDDPAVQCEVSDGGHHCAQTGVTYRDSSRS